MTECDNTITITDTTANPAPLGLLGFGMTTILLNLHNSGYYALDTMILAMGIFIGGVAQVMAGAMEWKKKNTFGTTAFTMYGLFWLSLVALLVLPKLGLGESASPVSMGCYLSVWGLFTACMFIGTLKLGRALQVVFLSLAVLFFMLAYADFSGTSKTLAGYEGIFCGLSACYAAIAQVLNEVYGRRILPL